MAEFTVLILQRRKPRIKDTKNYSICESIGVRTQMPDPRKMSVLTGKVHCGGHRERQSRGRCTKPILGNACWHTGRLLLCPVHTWQRGY